MLQNAYLHRHSDQVPQTGVGIRNPRTGELRIAAAPPGPRNDRLGGLSKGSTSISYAYDMDGIPLPSDSGFVIIGSVH